MECGPIHSQLTETYIQRETDREGQTEVKLCCTKKTGYECKEGGTGYISMHTIYQKSGYCGGISDWVSAASV